MNIEKFILKAIKSIKIFSFISIGASIALIIEYGIGFDFIFTLILSLILIITTKGMIREAQEGYIK